MIVIQIGKLGAGREVNTRSIWLAWCRPGLAHLQQHAGFQRFQEHRAATGIARLHAYQLHIFPREQINLMFQACDLPQRPSSSVGFWR